MSKAPEFTYTPDQVKALADGLVKELEEKLGVLVNIPGPQRNFKNTLLAFERATSDFDEALSIPVFMAYVSDNAALRQASQDLMLRISQYSVDLYTREDIFNALNEYAAKGEALGPVEARLLDKTLLDFKRNGMSAADFIVWARQNEEKMRREMRLAVIPTPYNKLDVPIGSILVYDRGWCDFNADSGHIEILTAQDRACSDGCESLDQNCFSDPEIRKHVHVIIPVRN